MPSDYYPVLLAFGVAMVIGTSLLVLSYLLGEQVGGRVKVSTVESGVPLLDVSHKRISVAFFLIAIDFIIFDIEAAFLYPWALVMEPGGWPLFWAVMVFVFLILVGFAYLWRKGGLDFAPRGNIARRAGR
jgi:NADH:ubiquinone oxidoreductase subunit 3 (subunit A)